MSILNKLPIFSRFFQRELELISEHAQFLIAEPGDIIIEQGAEDTCFYVLLTGRASVRLRHRRQAIAEVLPGEMFGEMGFALSTARTSWVVASEQSIMVRVDQALMKQLDCNVREKLKDQVIIKLATTIQNINSPHKDSD